jgi:hypothetical protein
MAQLKLTRVIGRFKKPLIVLTERRHNMETFIAVVLEAAASPLGWLVAVPVIGFAIYGVYTWAHKKPKQGGR